MNIPPELSDEAFQKFAKTLKPEELHGAPHITWEECRERAMWIIEERNKMIRKLVQWGETSRKRNWPEGFGFPVHILAEARAMTGD